MTLIQDQLINLLKSAIMSKKEYIGECDFDMVQDLAISHYSLSLACHGALLSGLTPPILWKNITSLTAIKNYKNLAVQKNVLSILKENDIPCAVLKGITAAVNYKTPMARSLGDIDILVQKKDYEKAVSLFGQSINQNENKFHTSFCYDGISVEIHEGIDNYKNCINGSKLSQIMDTALESVVNISFDGFEIPALQNKYQALVYLNHMYRHFEDNELTMRMFCDWVMFVSSVDDDEWNNTVYPLITSVGFDCFADVVNMAVHKYMGVETSNKVNFEHRSELADLIIEEFVFDGTKTGSKSMSGNIANAYAKESTKTSNRLVRIINVINGIVRQKTKIARYRIFLPFCWIYVGCSYFANLVSGKRKLISYKTISNVAKRRNLLKKEMKLK